MEKEIIILFGSGHSGKTTYAHKIEKEGYDYLSIDSHYHYNGEKEYFEFLDFICDNLNNTPHKNFVLDGYIYFDNCFDYLRERLKYHKIKAILVFASPEIILKRAENENTTMTKESIIKTYKEIIHNWQIDECVDTSNNDFKKVWKQKIYENLLVKRDVDEFLEKLKTKNYDKYYQTINLPFGMKIKGYNADYEHKSWDIISKLCNFENKKIADIGCFNGYFCFKVKECLAKKVVGYDKCIPAIETAKEVSNLKGLDVIFEVLDIEKQEIPEYDIILFLNISQHLKDPTSAFEKIFAMGGKIIIEMDFSNISKTKVIEIAEEHNHKLSKEIASARPNRVIMLFVK